MTGTEFRTAIAVLGLSQLGAARLLGVDGRTVRRWISGERDVPEPAARFLTFLIRSGITPDEVMKALCSLSVVTSN